MSREIHTSTTDYTNTATPLILEIREGDLREEPHPYALFAQGSHRRSHGHDVFVAQLIAYDGDYHDGAGLPDLLEQSLE